MHPDRREREALVAERVLHQGAQIQRHFAELGGRDLGAGRERARQPARDRPRVDRALGRTRRDRGHRLDRPGLRASRGRVGRHGGPLGERDVDAVAVRQRGHQHVAGRATRDLGMAVVPQAPVAVELERDRRGSLGVPAREGQVEERLCPGLVDRSPRIEDVDLAGRDAAGLCGGVPVNRAEQLRSPGKRRVLPVVVGGVHDAPGGLQPLPVDGGRRVVLVAVAALEVAPIQRHRRCGQRIREGGRPREKQRAHHHDHGSSQPAPDHGDSVTRRGRRRLMRIE